MIRFWIFFFACWICGACAQSQGQVKAQSKSITTTEMKSEDKKEGVFSPKGITKSIDEVMGKFDPSAHESFVEIDQKYADQAGRIMDRDAYAAFIKMYDAASKDGIRLIIKSATRNFNYQRGIWERKWTGVTKVGGESLATSIENHTERAKKILEYSSMPGTSRHHWGTDIDLNAFENSFFESGSGLEIYSWLQDHAAEYGFCQPYTPKGRDRPDGYNEEKWHWSYLPVANQYLRTAREQIQDSMISGFKGSATAVEIGVVEKYILGINKACR